MTGEYCSKQTNIQYKRKELHSGKKVPDQKKGHSKEEEQNEKQIHQISAFVIMNFSDMSDVVYKWRLHDFIESLSKYLYLDKDKKRLYCHTSEKEGVALKDIIEHEEVGEIKKIDKVNVIRSDSDPASNYVICSRICQQMQIADLVIVDVSSQNPNVFYELGMAVALGKLILPICYSESYYKLVVPEEIKRRSILYSKIEHHIGCFPWRKNLFEYYGIRYRRWNKQDIEKDEDEKGNTKTRYLPFKTATNTKYGFSDIKYNRFPYHKEIGQENEQEKKKIGEIIYNKLAKEYNKSSKEDNTLVIYTMDGFSNKQEAGRCIVNFYHNITDRMRQEQCFCGERVGVLVQENFIPENDKDTKEQLNLYYSVGEIIHIGVNQATYLATEDKIKADDSIDNIELKKNHPLSIEEEQESKLYKMREEQREDITHYIKGHIRNRAILIYPNNPVYVSRVENGIDELNLSENTEKSKEMFCLYHVMLKTLRNTNEIVVDLSNNCLQSLFWLGAAHGSDIYAITVLHEETDKEREIITGTSEKKTRNIFDVAGLWTAILHSNDTEGFYKQLALVQKGIERHSHLMLSEELYINRKDEEKRVLESYYLDYFWKHLLKYNRLWIYLPQILLKENENINPKKYTSKWHSQLASTLSYYLSERTLIGEYQIKFLEKDSNDLDASNVNFICVGEYVSPLEKGLAEYIYEQSKSTGGNLKVHKLYKNTDTCEYSEFFPVGSDLDVDKKELEIRCSNCEKFKLNRAEENIELELESKACYIDKEESIQKEKAQLILWRENPKNLHERTLFRVSMVGISSSATLGLTALFVGKEQKRSLFLNGGKFWEKQNFLYELQKEARSQFMKLFREKLIKELNDILKEEINEAETLEMYRKERYMELVLYTVHDYLNSVLYRYFLPFLLEKDINRIYNGMKTLINSMKANAQSPFCLEYPTDGDPDYEKIIEKDSINKIVEKIPQVLKEVLQSFRGLEVFYQVKISNSLEIKADGGISKKCKKGVLDIEMMTGQDGVNCFFL